MSKAIIKLNIHLPDEQFYDFVKMVNNQLKNDIVYVPYYCSVYMIDGSTDIKVEKSDEMNCHTCKHGDRYPNCPGCGENFNKWEAKDE